MSSFVSDYSLIKGVLNLIKFDERDPEQGFIPRDQFFYRYTFEFRARTIKVRYTPYRAAHDSHLFF